MLEDMHISFDFDVGDPSVEALVANPDDKSLDCFR